MILFLNAGVRSGSRTKRLADHLLSKLDGTVTELRLAEVAFPAADESFIDQRERLTAQGDYGDKVFDLAKQFAEADLIVIAAPYWDLSFPSSLKQYLEQINVVGITFKYSPDGIPQGLCKAAKLYYVTTAGGNFVPEEYGYGYVKALAQSFYGISDVELIEAIGLDLYGSDAEQILRDRMRELDNRFAEQDL